MDRTALSLFGSGARAAASGAGTEQFRLQKFGKLAKKLAVIFPDQFIAFAGSRFEGAAVQHAH